jgi:excisionase family DNA binding protein/PAS domain S-box-containing protein
MSNEDHGQGGGLIGVDGEIDAGTETGDSRLQGVGSDRFTMAEAARLKGVSYHTVSRAVRRGRLPVLRLGRMALIAADDLQKWRPMKERAPRKYRQREPVSDTSGVLINLVSTDQLQLARRLSTLYEIIYTTSSEGSLDALADVVTQRMAESFQLSRLVLWQIDEEAHIARRLAAYGGYITNLPDELPLSDVGYFALLAERGSARIILKSRADMPDTVHTKGMLPDTPVLVIPLVRKDRVVGFMLGDRGGADLEMSPEQLALAEGIASQMAMAIDNAMLREVETQRRLQLEAILDELNAGVAAYDKDGFLTLANAAEREIFDLTEDEARLGQHWSEYLLHKRRENLDGEPVEIPDNPLVRALNGEHLHDLQHVVVRKNDERLYVSTNARPITVGGRIVGAVTISRNITAQRESELRDKAQLAQLELGARRSRAIAEIVVDVNSGTDVETVTEAALRRITTEFEGVYGLAFLRDDEGHFRLVSTYNMPEHIVTPNQFDAVSLPNTVLSFARHRPMVIRLSETAVNAGIDGIDETCSAFLIIPLQVQEQHVGVAYVGFVDDPQFDESDLTFAAILGRQAAQAIDKARLTGELEFAHGRLLAVVDQLPQAVLIMDYPNAEVITANKAAERLWARPLDGGHVRGGALPVVNAEGVVLDVDDHPLLRPLRTRKESLGEPLTVLQPDGTQVEVLANHAPVFDARGTIVGAVSVLQNRSDFKPLDRAKDEFISVVAHELRNPLTSLRGNLQLLQRRIGKRGGEHSEDEIRRLGTVVDQVDRIADLVSRMLDVSRVDLGSLDISAHEADAAEIVQAVVNEAMGLNPNRPILLDRPETLPVVWDAVRVQQILLNLMTNAARYAPEGPVEVGLSVNDRGRVITTVRDHGPGVPPRIQRRLFKQYYRFDDGQDDRGVAVDGNRGLGIGLYISARLARAHGGSLTVENAPGGGAVFTLDMPVNGMASSLR